MNQVQDDEIDLFNLFQKLWDGKWIISVFVAIAVLLGGGFLFSKEAVYQSKLIFSLDTTPPFYGADKVSTDFQKKFYSASLFKKWKQNNSNISIVFEDLSKTEVVDGFVLSKSKDKQLATLTTKKNEPSFLLVKTNQLPILDDFFKYLIYINEELNFQYVDRAKKELKIIRSRFENLTLAEKNIVDLVLSIDRYLVSAEKSASVLNVQHPTIPKKISPRVELILAISAMLGGIIGVFFIVVRNAITKRL